MVALTAARHTWSQQTIDTLRIPMAADAVIYEGGMVCVDADGYAVPAADTADYKFAGVCDADPQQPGVTTFDNSGGSDGDMHVLVRQRGRFRYHLAVRTPNQNMLFAIVYVSDDQTVAVHAWDVVNEIRCGHIVRLPADTLGMDAQADFSSDEVEIQLSGEPFEWGGDVTTTTAAPTTTTTAQ